MGCGKAVDPWRMCKGENPLKPAADKQRSRRDATRGVRGAPQIQAPRRPPGKRKNASFCSKVQKLTAVEPFSFVISAAEILPHPRRQTKMQMLQRSIAAPSLLLLLAHVTPSNGFLPGLLPAARLPPSSRGLPCSARLHKISRVATLRMAASLGPLSYGEEAASIDESIVVLDLQMRVAELPAGTVPPPFPLSGEQKRVVFFGGAAVPRGAPPGASLGARPRGRADEGRPAQEAEYMKSLGKEELLRWVPPCALFVRSSAPGKASAWRSSL